MKSGALYLLALSTITQAGPWNHDGRGQGLVKTQGAEDGPGSVRGFTPPVGVEPGVQIEANSTPTRPKSIANIASNEQPPNGQQPPIEQPAIAPGFEGHVLRISTVTVTVTAQGSGAASPATVTVTQLAASQGNGGNAAAVTITELASTITQTVTFRAPCAAGQRQRGGGAGQGQRNSTAPGQVVVIIENGNRNRNGQGPRTSGRRGGAEKCYVTRQGDPGVVCGRTTPSNSEATAPTAAGRTNQTRAEVLPTTNANGNGVGVSTIPIAESARPKTTLNNAASSPAAVAPQPKPSSSSLSQATPPVASASAPALSSKGQPAVPLPVPSRSGRRSSIISNSAPGQPTPASSSTSETISAAVSSTSAATSTSTPSPSRLAESLTLGGLGPSPTAIKDSAVAPGPTPGATPGPGVVAPAQPVVNLSGLNLSSVLDLGNLLRQSEPTQSSTKAL
ncbi:hypothetical protein C2857_002343 [Epichloe festucae Fl1]|uniref:Uncharacterized protein n=1 Tax=Epichloe festucae (strain Fl1) TaxID=877507 RepID=A0A7S9KNS4_EPIFF|nr:hypothetical protein C2857_002343 [Epichloe festucae Fl1]